MLLYAYDSDSDKGLFNIQVYNEILHHGFNANYEHIGQVQASHYQNAMKCMLGDLY